MYFAEAEYENIFNNKIKLCRTRLEICSLTPSNQLTEQNFIQILKSLKSNKSRDPHGLVNKIFQYNNIGEDLYSSLFSLLLRIKQEILLPTFMHHVNIHAVYKGKGDRLDLDNNRGIFIVNIF